MACIGNFRYVYIILKETTEKSAHIISAHIIKVYAKKPNALYLPKNQQLAPDCRFLPLDISISVSIV